MSLPRYEKVDNFWWDTYTRSRAIEAGEPDPGPLYRRLPDRERLSKPSLDRGWRIEVEDKSIDDLAFGQPELAHVQRRPELTIWHNGQVALHAKITGLELGPEIMHLRRALEMLTELEEANP